MKKISLFLITLLSTFSISCSNQISNIDSENSNISSKQETGLSFKFVKPEEIPTDVLKVTSTQAKDMADKESKRRDIDFFNLPKNPIGLEISSGGNKLGWILNYIGTSQNTADLNIEMKALYSEKSSIYSLNYSGPVTNSRKINLSKQDLKNNIKLQQKVSKDNVLQFELIDGLPPESIVRTFSDYIENLKSLLKRYQPQKIDISEDAVFIYAIKYNGQDIGFFFESHANKVILGERKYADLQVGVMVSMTNSIKANYAILAFNPKTQLNKDPVYKYINESSIKLIQLGEL